MAKKIRQRNKNNSSEDIVCFFFVIMMILITILLCFVVCYTNGLDEQIIGCEICIVDASCDDDGTYFNLSVSKDCHAPLEIYYNYDTEIHSLKRYANESIDCSDCYYDLTVEIERDAWDYTLTIVSPRSSDSCSIYTAHCGGKVSLLVWYITGGLSGLFTLLGLVVCTVRCYRANQEKKTPQPNSRTALLANA